MNCQDCQNEVLQHAKLSDDAQAHLDGCAECRAFAQVLTLAVPPTPSKELDARVISGCHGVLAAQRRLRRTRRALLSIAAVVAVLLSVAIFHTQSQSPLVAKPEFAGSVLPAEEYTEALSWDVGVSLSSAELDQVELDLELLTAGL